MGLSRLLHPILLLLSALVLDGGVLFHYVATAAAAHWLCAAFMLIRYGKGLSAVDRDLLRYGFYLWLILAIVLAAVIHG